MTTNHIQLSSPDLVRLNQIITQATSDIQELVGDNNVTLSVVFPQHVSLKMNNDRVFTGLTLDKVMQVTCDHLGLNPNDVKSRSRFTPFSRARHIFRHLSYKVFKLGSYQEIAEYVNSINHTTTLHACNKTEDLLVTSPEFLSDYKVIYSKLYEMEFNRQADWNSFYKAL